MKFLISILFLFNLSAQTQVFYGVDSARPGDKECRLEVLKFKDNKISIRIFGGYDNIRKTIRDIEVYKIQDRYRDIRRGQIFRGDINKRVRFINNKYISFFFRNGYSKELTLFIEEFEPENEYIKVSSFDYSQHGSFHKHQSIGCDIE